MAATQTLIPGTAKIEKRQTGSCLVSYMFRSGHLLGERVTADEREALAFCREHGLRVR